MTSGDRPAAVCLDYGRTLVDFARPEQDIAAVGVDLAGRLPLAGTAWIGRPGEFALALDQLTDELVAVAQRAHPFREADFKAVHREAMRQLLGAAVDVELSAAVGAALQRAWVAGMKVVEPARTVLAGLRARGLRLGLCSNAPYPPTLMREQLERLEVAQYFDATVFSSEIGWRKPDPRIFRELLSRLGLSAAEVWFVGDEWEADIEGAEAAGMRAILAPGVGQPGAGALQLSSWGDLLSLVG
ncbi:MAG: HAD family hydrolase [Candidatus Dormibacteria bacterium]